MSGGRRIRNAEWIAAAAAAGDFPPPREPEVALLGRSNVGKSSLLNRLAGRRSLARTSGTPGKTRLLHWYRLERGDAVLALVDLPGYGFAKVSRVERQSWRRLVEAYLSGRSALRVAVLLQDLRREWSEDEALLLEWLTQRGVPVLVALTKCDKEKPMRRAERERALREAIGLPASRVIATSATKGTGIDALWKAIDAELQDRS
jgi:GTP-binding protein